MKTTLGPSPAPTKAWSVPAGQWTRSHDRSRPAAPSDGHDDRRRVAGADEHVRRAAGAVEEVPGAERLLLALDHEDALAGKHEESLLRALAVVQPERVPGRLDVDVDPELR